MNETPPNDPYSESSNTPIESPRMSAPSDVPGDAAATSYDPDYFDDRPPSTWPTVFGIIGMILGILGLLSSICAPILQVFSQMVPDAPQMNFSVGYQVWQYSAYIIGFILAIVLITASTKLLRRNPGGASMMRGWAIASILWTLIATTLGFIFSAETVKQMDVQMQGSGGGNNPMEPEMMALFVYGGMVAGAVFALIFPIVCLFWFARAKTKEDIRSWAQ